MLERLQVSPADQVDAPDCHPYIVVYHLTDEQEGKLKKLTELAHCYYKVKKENFTATPADFLQSAIAFGSTNHIDDAFFIWERMLSDFIAGQQNEGLEEIQHDT